MYIVLRSSYVYVIFGWMMFSCIVSIIICSLFPIYHDLFLSLSISELMVVHIPGFGLLLMHVVSYKPMSCIVVGLDRSWRLWVVERLQNISYLNYNLSIVKYTSSFCLGYQRYNAFDGFVFCKYRSLSDWIETFG